MDFQQLKQLVPSATEETWHQHSNGGGWVQNTAFVEETAFVGPDARVSESARVSENARVYGNAQVFGDAWVYGDAWVSGDANQEETEPKTKHFSEEKQPSRWELIVEE